MVISKSVFVVSLNYTAVFNNILCCILFLNYEYILCVTLTVELSTTPKMANLNDMSMTHLVCKLDIFVLRIVLALNWLLVRESAWCSRRSLCIQYIDIKIIIGEIRPNVLFFMLHRDRTSASSCVAQDIWPI